MTQTPESTKREESARQAYIDAIHAENAALWHDEAWQVLRDRANAARKTWLAIVREEASGEVSASTPRLSDTP